MFFARFKCPRCGEVFKKLALLVRPDSTGSCPKCGTAEVPLIEEDALELRRVRSRGCSKFG